jgi:hypothetical protein
VAIPPAYGQTSAPTQLCGYTVRQMRSAYGVTSSQGVPGFAPGQYTEDLDGDNIGFATTYAVNWWLICCGVKGIM